MNARQLAQQHLAPTSFAPTGLHIVRASGSYLYEVSGKQLLDLIGGISVCNVGHSHPRVIEAIQQQAAQFLHVMVYGEVVQTPQASYAATLAAHLPPSLDCIFFTTSGAEAVEGAIKLSRRVTGRPGIIGARRSYHGATTGALALMGDEYWKGPFRPLLPGVRQYAYGSQELMNAIDADTACVVLEPVQAEAGINGPFPEWMQAVAQRCRETGTLLVLDEIQTGFGRTGTLWAFEQLGIVPDILMLGKALGGGMPMGAFVASQVLMHQLADNPVLGHLTTFGGHPVCCAAGEAAFRVLLEEDIVPTVFRKEALFREWLQHPAIREVRSIGLLMAVQLDSAEAVQQCLQKCAAAGLFSDWFLFAADCIRIAPPLTISESEIREACRLLCRCL
ncbi:MAG: aspartate aminotransferase family protein [Sphingobacteriales bacterium]|nr:MAG: aspartate aminotransferase family protein [Sphingobacteriales bacterium]